MATMYTRLLKLDDIPKDRSIFIFGPRATGKTTLVNNFNRLQKNWLTYDLLKSEDFLRLNSSPETFRKEVSTSISRGGVTPEGVTPGGILNVHIDEVQKVPRLLDEVQFLIENFPGRVRFILSGSSARKLKRFGSNLLAGRAWEYHIYPFTITELKNNFDLDLALQFGTIPSVFTLSSRDEKIETLKSYVSTYLQEEIQAEALVRQLDAFHRFLEAAAFCNGEIVNMSDISREASVARKTVIEYYKILEDTLLGFFLPSWGHHLSRKKLVEHGKFYFFDTGVVTALNKRLTAPLERANPLYGRVFEHFCILEFIRLHDYKRTEHKVGFFRTRAGSEVDLIQERHGHIRAIEIKSTINIDSSHVRGLLNFSDEFPDAELILVGLLPRPIEINGVKCVPYREFFEEEWKKSLQLS